MRKHRKWLMGFGIGIVLGATMLQLILFAREQDQALKESENPKIYTQRQLDDAVAKAVEEARQQAAANSPAPSASAQASPSPSASQASPDQQQHEKVYVLYITPGMDLKTVARSLQNIGLIEDANDFTEAARSISRKMEVGSATFKEPSTYKEIIAELTRPK